MNSNEDEDGDGDVDIFGFPVSKKEMQAEQQNLQRFLQDQEIQRQVKQEVQQQLQEIQQQFQKQFQEQMEEMQHQFQEQLKQQQHHHQMQLQQQQQQQQQPPPPPPQPQHHMQPVPINVGPGGMVMGGMGNIPPNAMMWDPPMIAPHMAANTQQQPPPQQQQAQQQCSTQVTTLRDEYLETFLHIPRENIYFELNIKGFKEKNSTRYCKIDLTDNNVYKIENTTDISIAGNTLSTRYRLNHAKNAANQGTDSMKSSSKQMEVPLAIDKSVGFVTISKAKIPTSTDYIDYSKEVAKFCLLEKPDNGNYGYYNGSRTTLYAMPTSDDSYKLCPSRCCALDSNYAKVHPLYVKQGSYVTFYLNSQPGALQSLQIHCLCKQSWKYVQGYPENKSVKVEISDAPKSFVCTSNNTQIRVGTRLYITLRATLKYDDGQTLVSHKFYYQLADSSSKNGSGGNNSSDSGSSSSGSSNGSFQYPENTDFHGNPSPGTDERDRFTPEKNSSVQDLSEQLESIKLDEVTNSPGSQQKQIAPSQTAPLDVEASPDSLVFNRDFSKLPIDGSTTSVTPAATTTFTSSLSTTFASISSVLSSSPAVSNPSKTSISSEAELSNSPALSEYHIPHSTPDLDSLLSDPLANHESVFRLARDGKLKIATQTLTEEEKSAISAEDWYIYDSRLIECWADNRSWSNVTLTKDGSFIYQEVENVVDPSLHLASRLKTFKPNGLYKVVVLDSVTNSSLRLVCYVNTLPLSLQNSFLSYGLHTASLTGELNVVKELIKDGVDVNLRNSDGLTSLYCAASEGHLLVVQELLASGADVNKACVDGYRALFAAASNGHLDILMKLLEKGAHINHQSVQGYTALYFASRNGHLSVVKELLAKGASVNEVSESGFTALLVASQNGHDSIVKELLENGAHANHRDVNGSTALHIASHQGHFPVVEALLASGANVYYKESNGMTPLHFASESGHLPVVEALLANGADMDDKEMDGMTALHVASQNGHDSIVKILLEKGATANYKNVNGFTALHIASHQGHIPVVKELLAKGANVNETTSEGISALQIASSQGHLQILKELLRYGAFVDHKSK